MRIVFISLFLLLSGCASLTNSPTEVEETLVHTPPVEDNALTEPSEPVALVFVENILPSEAEDVWHRIRIQLQFAPSHHERVQNRVDWYLKHPNYMETITKRAEPFLYYIVNEVERRGLPIELALMPLIESDFDTSAYSHKHASGLWQLTPLIAKHYGVKIGPWYDGRQDVIDATNAALDFLTYLHKRFDGNWYHAIAAYNTGEGRVARAIRNNKKQGKSTDFFYLKLPRQTRHYVPKLLAAAQLLRDETMAFPKIANQPTIDVIDMRHGVILDDKKKWAQLEVLNPGYTRFPALLDGPKHLVLRKGESQNWKDYVANLPEMPSEQWQKYTIRRGDSLSVIAKRHSITVSQLKSFNQLKSSRIRAGDTLMLPILADKQIEYKVKSGDSLWRIARHFDVTISKLKQWNSLSKDVLRIGDKLTIFLAAP
ncbi:lytic transglycosylase [Pseudoalteromonas phenolica]|uniref:LysM peptidoglycan-binding domain-containing protein n=1 Tax=Pseudoalteromonas phenolica TaxID=161398 RepID=UPI00110BD6A1|nr:LysM peptidoglycan-binding domain-containing protein [Pseudoalteromonas phenolica]TMN88138.1 lytic transglycosylase [Pseudoalteromonas phenolica]